MKGQMRKRKALDPMAYVSDPLRFHFDSKPLHFRDRAISIMSFFDKKYDALKFTEAVRDAVDREFKNEPGRSSFLHWCLVIKAMNEQNQ